MGTETVNIIIHHERLVLFRVKLNNPLMGTETQEYILHYNHIQNRKLN